MQTIILFVFCIGLRQENCKLQNMLFFDDFDRIIRILKTEQKTSTPILKILLILSKNRLCSSPGSATDR